MEFIKSIALRSQVVAHQLIWNMKTNMYTDEEMHHKDSEYFCHWTVRVFLECTRLLPWRGSFSVTLYDTLESLTNAIVNSLSGPAKKFYEREFNFFSQITDVSGKIRPFPKGINRRAFCVTAAAAFYTLTDCRNFAFYWRSWKETSVSRMVE